MLRNVSKEVIIAIRDACDRVLADKCYCGSDTNFVIGVAVDDDCTEVAHVDLYEEFSVASPHYEVPVWDAVEIVAKSLAWAAFSPSQGLGSPGEDLERRLLQSLRLGGESPLRWQDGKPMRMKFEQDEMQANEA